MRMASNMYLKAHGGQHRSMIISGWFGKYAGEKEFISKGVKGNLSLWLRNWIEQGHDFFVAEFPETKGELRRCLKFFLIDSKSKFGVIGIMRKSADSEGRWFPATAFVGFPVPDKLPAAYLPVVMGEGWRELQGSGPDTALETAKRAVQGFIKDPNGTITAVEDDLKNVMGNTTFDLFCKLCGLQNSQAFSTIFDLNRNKKKKGEVAPVSVKARLPAKKPLSFVCLWYLLLKYCCSITSYPHCFVSEADDADSEFTIFFRWPLKTDFLSLQGVYVVNELEHDLTRVRNKGVEVPRWFDELVRDPDVTLSLVIDAFRRHGRG